MRLLITGATGHSGVFFLEYLNNNNLGFDSIRCIVRATSDLSVFKNFNNLDFEYVQGDIENQDFLNEVASDVDVILNIANIRFSTLLVEAAVKNSVPWLIGVHTTGRYSKFKSASSEYIAIEDKLLAERKIDLTILRPTMIYGSMRDKNMSKLVKFLDKSPVFPIFGDGSNLMQPVRAQDLGKAYYDVLKNREKTMNKEYNLSGADEIRYEQIINVVSGYLNKKTYLIKLPIKLSYGFTKMANKIIPKFPINEEQVLRMQEDKVFSHEDAKKDFGYSPSSFKEGIKFEVEEYLRGKGRKQ